MIYTIQSMIYLKNFKKITENLYNTINDLFETFQENHRDFSSKGNKAAGGRARKSIGEIKKLVTDYRKASVSESK